ICLPRPCPLSTSLFTLFSSTRLVPSFTIPRPPSSTLFPYTTLFRSRGKLWQVVYSSTTLFSCTAARCRSRSPAQDAPADIGNPDRWSRGGDESRPQRTSCRFYAATLMNAGFPAWTSRGEPAVGPEISRSRATQTMTNDTSEYDAGHSCGPSFALGGPCRLGSYP